MKTVARAGQKAGVVIMVMMTLFPLRCTMSITGGNTSTVDNKVCGVIYDTNGQPAENATVVMRPVDYIPHVSLLGKHKADDAVFVCTTHTDPNGKYRFTSRDSIPAGEYSIEVRDVSGNCLIIQNILVDSLLLHSNAWLGVFSPKFDTKMKPPGTIRGTVPSAGDSLTGKVFVYGLDNYAVIDRGGGFVLENIPAGNLRLKIVAVGNGIARSDTITVTTRPAATTTVSGLPASAAIRVDATRMYQTIDGFGASSAWIDKLITPDLATIFWKDDTLDGHIGLSLLRTRIDSKGFTYDESEVPMMKAIGVNPDIRIWSTSWTPPEQFKDNNSLIGGQFNSDSASMQGFAEFLVEYVHDVKMNTGIDLYAVSCQNEPDAAGMTLEGCTWTGEQLRVFLKDYWGPACEKANITAKRMIGESVRNDLAVSDPSLTDTTSANYLDIVGTHLYLGGPHPYPLADSLHKPYWVTEISGLDGVDTSIANGITWANQIHDCIVRCNMSAYHYWWLVNWNDDDEGLCNSKGEPTPRMYTLGNFSKFIRPGFVRVAAAVSTAADVRVSAYYGSSAKRLVIVAINSGPAATIDITIPDISKGKAVVPWLTDGTHRLERQQSVALSKNTFPSILPSRSVVTFVLGDVEISSD